MSDNLLDLVYAARGGRAIWQDARTLHATVNVYGGFWQYKGHGHLLGVEQVTLDIATQRVTMSPFGTGNTLHFDAAQDLVTLVDAAGTVIDRLVHPRASMAGYRMDMQWTPLQMGYFISYATWTYLMVPHLFTLPGVTTRELTPWLEDGETWRRLEATFPPSIATHGRVMVYYFDAQTGQERRMDYDAEVNGWSEVAHYVSEHTDFNGLTMPTRRRVLHRGPQNEGMHASSDIALDISNVILS